MNDTIYLPPYDDAGLAMTSEPPPIAPDDTYTREAIEARLNAFTEATRRFSEAVRDGARPPQSSEPRIYKNKVRCCGCGDLIMSTSRHEFVTCKCGDVSVDGGTAYLRRVFREGAKWEELSVTDETEGPGRRFVDTARSGTEPVSEPPPLPPRAPDSPLAPPARQNTLVSAEEGEGDGPARMAGVWRSATDGK